MSLFIEGMNCALCERPMTADDQVFGTWGVWLPSTDRLHHFCDATLHWGCYAEWKYRERFAKSYFEFWAGSAHGNSYWRVVYRDEQILVTANTDVAVSSAWIVIAETGSRLSVALSEWDEWLASVDHDDRHPVEQAAIKRVKATLSQCVPTRDAIERMASGC